LPTPTPSPYYEVGSEPYANAAEFVDSLNAWSAGLGTMYDYGDGTYGTDIAHLNGNQLNLRGDIVVGSEPITISTDMEVLVLNTGYGGKPIVTISRAPTYDGTLLVIETGAAVTWQSGTELILDGDGHGAAPLLEIQSGSSLAVHNITAVNGVNPNGNGGGISNEGGLSATSLVNVSGNTAKNGAGIYNLGSLALDWARYIITNNVASENGGGIYNGGSGPVSIQGNITQNSAGNGGGIYNIGTMTFNGDLVSNLASQNGGGLYNTGSYTMNWGSFSGNTAGSIGNHVYATGTSSNAIPTWLITLTNGGGYYYAD